MHQNESKLNEDINISAAATPLIILPDMSESDIDAEWDAMVRRSKAMDEFLDGEISFSEYSEFLDHDGIDIPEYLDQWEENLDFIYSCV